MTTVNKTDNQRIHEDLLGLCSACQQADHATHADECIPFGDVPAYDSDPAACLELIEALRAKGWRYWLQDAPGGVGHVAEFGWPGIPDKNHIGKGDTLPAAVSAATIKLINSLSAAEARG